MKSKIQALRARLEGVRAEQQRILDAVNSESRASTAIELKQLGDLRSKVLSIEEEIGAEAESMERERGLTGSAINVDGIVSRQDDPAKRGTILRGQPRTYNAMFGNPAGANITVKDFMSAIHSGMHRPEIAAATSTEGFGADGGFIVPEQFSARMLDLALESEIVRPRARIEPMTSDTKKVSGFDNTVHTSSIGGFAVAWTAEAATIAAQKGLLRRIELRTRKAAILAECSNELIEDGGQTWDSMLTGQLGAGISFGMDDAFLNGPGGAQPLGVLNDPAMITILKESSQAADTIVYENLIKMFSQMHPALIRDAVWVANVGCLPQLLQLQQKIKNVAGSENVGGSWVPVLREDGSGNLTLLTRPLILTEKLPVLGDAGDIIFAAFSQYIVGMRKTLTIDKSSHLGFASDTSHYRITARVDGQGAWKGPMTPKRGPALSWCTKLEARA